MYYYYHDHMDLRKSQICWWPHLGLFAYYCGNMHAFNARTRHPFCDLHLDLHSCEYFQFLPVLKSFSPFQLVISLISLIHIAYQQKPRIQGAATSRRVNVFKDTTRANMNGPLTPGDSGPSEAAPKLPPGWCDILKLCMTERS